MNTTRGKLRNITSGILHTSVGDVYSFFEEYLGEKGIMTHHLPVAGKAILPILKRNLDDSWFTDEWVKEALDESVDIPDLTDDERTEFWRGFESGLDELWDKIANKTIIVTTPDK